MEIELGKPVVSSDGDRVGTVDSLVLDVDTKEVRQFIVKQGALLTTDRIVDRPLIERIGDDNTVYLNVSSEMVEQLPPFAEEQFTAVREDELQYLPHSWVFAGGASPLYWGPGHLGRGYDPHGAMFAPAPIDPPEVEVQSNLREDTIVINSGTDVVGRDGDKIGTVDEVVYDENGTVVGFMVKAGFIFHHDVRVSADWIDSITGDTVHLNMTADEVEHSGRVD